MEQEGIEDLIEKVVSGQATPEERRKLAETDAVERLMKKQWDSNNRQPIYAETEQRMWENIVTRCGFPKKRAVLKSRHMWYAACAIALLVIGSFWLMKENKHDGNTIEYQEVIAREPRILTLPDHTKIWMQAGTSIRYAQTFNESRKVWLKGDATFEVTKHAGQPFKVYLNDVFIEVKGTTFHISNRRDNVSKVALYSGRVDFHSMTDNKVIEMKPNQRLTYRSSGSITMEGFSNIKWQHGIYKFSDMRLDSLIGTINGIYDIDVVLSAEVSRKTLFTGTIRYDERLEDVIDKICYVTDLKCKKENDKLIIYKH